MKECKVTVKRPYDPVRATRGSCDWMKTVSAVWGGCEVAIDHSPDEGFCLSSCDTLTVSDHPITYCPGCGGKLVLQEK